MLDLFRCLLSSLGWRRQSSEIGGDEVNKNQNDEKQSDDWSNRESHVIGHCG